MKLIYFPEDLPAVDARVVGGKALALFRLCSAGLPVPRPMCISTSAYDLFVDDNNLREKILLELYRKDLKDMRWEEIWDASLFIQNLFIKTNMPAQIRTNLQEVLHDGFSRHDRTFFVVRSSAPEEDGMGGSFAGLHESYVNVTGIDELLKSIKKVWASLWSDRAILYRQELGLEVRNSNMAVVIQPFIEGAASGVMFTRSPLEQGQMIIEAVHGLNQGLVDGAVEPDRWLVSRSDGTIISHQRPQNRTSRFDASSRGGVHSVELDNSKREVSPLSENQVNELIALGLEVENYFNSAQDIEWTIADTNVSLLQSRPITTQSGVDASDKRAWYLSLTRSYDNLLKLWDSIANELLPEMDEDAARLAAQELDELSDIELAAELEQRSAINEKWSAVYWRDFIPFAHGVRLFGEIYNDVIEPDDPFEFVTLLTGQNMLSVERNELFLRCAQMIQADAALMSMVRAGKLEGSANAEFQDSIARLKSYFSVDYLGTGEQGAVNDIICAMILQYTKLGGEARMPTGQGRAERERLEAAFIDKGAAKLPVDPHRLLHLARESYRLRDDDNIHIGRIGKELERAAEHARARCRAAGDTPLADLRSALRGEPIEDKGSTGQAVETSSAELSAPERVKARQLLGQPASMGIAQGVARVVYRSGDLAEFKQGEVLVIDSIDPTMTVFAPLAAGIIERRGGMLIHGAIIAREYGIPCITGVVDATSYIKTGDLLTVDGYLGICTIRRRKGEA